MRLVEKKKEEGLKLNVVINPFSEKEYKKLRLILRGEKEFDLYQLKQLKYVRRGGTYA